MKTKKRTISPLSKLILGATLLFATAQNCTGMQAPASPKKMSFPRSLTPAAPFGSPRHYQLRHKRFEHIIFDLFGVLLYVDKPLATKTIGAKYACDFDPEAVMSCPTWPRLDLGMATAEDVAADPTHHQNPAAVAEYIHTIGRFIKPIKVGIEIYKKIKAQNYYVYILSNLSVDCYSNIIYQPYFDRVSRTIGWDCPNIFDGIAGGAYSFFLRLGKPALDIYKLFLDTFHQAWHKSSEDFAQECLFIDDSPRNLIGAQQAGIATTSCQTHAITYLFCVKNGIFPPDEEIERQLDPRELEIFGTWSIEELGDYDRIKEVLNELRPAI